MAAILDTIHHIDWFWWSIIIPPIACCAVTSVVLVVFALYMLYDI